jgi:hypothetical protein
LDNTSWNWERSHFETFMRRLDDGRAWARKALDADDRETAVGYATWSPFETSALSVPPPCSASSTNTKDSPVQHVLGLRQNLFAIPMSQQP